nr:hypothetical protein [Tanacetum cinerariifolium]
MACKETAHEPASARQSHHRHRRRLRHRRCDFPGAGRRRRDPGDLRQPAVARRARGRAGQAPAAEPVPASGAARRSAMCWRRGQGPRTLWAYRRAGQQRWGQRQRRTGRRPQRVHRVAGKEPDPLLPDDPFVRRRAQGEQRRHRQYRLENRAHRARRHQ